MPALEQFLAFSGPVKLADAASSAATMIWRDSSMEAMRVPTGSPLPVEIIA